VHMLELLFEAVLPILVLVWLAYHFTLVRDAIRHLTRFVEWSLCELALAIDRVSASLRSVVRSSTRLVTHDGAFPLPC
jgi:hypothetical protein